MPKIYVVENCGNCPHSSSITLAPVKPYHTVCFQTYEDERKLNRKLVTDWRKLPEWCPLEDI
jgi:hypothetical protein